MPVFEPLHVHERLCPQRNLHTICPQSKKHYWGVSHSSVPRSLQRDDKQRTVAIHFALQHLLEDNAFLPPSWVGLIG